MKIIGCHHDRGGEGGTHDGLIDFTDRPRTLSLRMPEGEINLLDYTPCITPEPTRYKRVPRKTRRVHTACLAPCAKEASSF